MKSLAALLVLVVALILFLIPEDEVAAILMVEREPELEQELDGLDPEQLSEVGGEAVAREAVADSVEPVAATPEPADLSNSSLVRVRVVDEEQDPITKANVFASYTDQSLRAAGTRLPQAITDDAGTAELEVQPGYAFELLVSKGNDISRERIAVRALAVGQIHEAVVQVKTRDDATYRARVLRADGAQPIAGVRVHLKRTGQYSSRPRPLDNEKAPAAVTDADGLFEVQARSWAATLALFSAPGWSPKLVQLVAESPDGSIREVLLERAGQITGVVQPARGGSLEVHASTNGYRLAEGMSMGMLARGTVLFQAEIDASGYFQLKDLPCNAPLAIRIMDGRRTRMELPQSITLRPGEVREVQWQSTGAGSIRGIVVDVHGQPVPNQRVWLLTRAAARPGFLRTYNKRSESARADADGRFEFSQVQPGTWTVGLAPLSPGRQRSEQTAAFAPLAVAVIVPDHGLAVEVELVVYRDLFVEGVIRTLEGQNQKARTQLYSSELSASLSDNSAEDGTFKIGPLPPGTYRLSAYPHSDPELARSEPMNVQAGDSGIELVLRPGVALSGRVIGLPEGAAQAQWVTLSGTGDLLSMTSIREGGSFAFKGLLVGTYNLSIATEGGQVGLLPGIAISPGEELTDLELLLEPGGRLLIYYSGAKEYGQLRVRKSGVVVAHDGLQSGTEQRFTVPTGEIEVTLLNDTRKVFISAGEETVVRFELPE